MEQLLTVQDIFKNQFPIRVYKVSEGWPTQEHSHEYMQIWYVLQGTCTHIVEDTCYQLTMKNLLIIPPFISHTIENETDDFVIIGCEFPLDVIAEDNLIKRLNCGNLLGFTYTEIFETVIQHAKPCYIPSLQCQVQIEHLLDNMLRELENKEQFYEISLKADLLKLLTFLARDYNTNETSQKISNCYCAYIDNALKYIHDNFQNKLYIKEVAQTVAMSESYFSYFFKEVTGKTFIEYLSALRIEKAKELIKETDLSIAEIGAMVGFKENAYFNKVFKKEVNCTPAGYRNKFRE